MEIRNQILFGHIDEKIKEIPEGSVHVAITSPPYWGLRDYKTEPVIFCLTKKQEKCDHKFMLTTRTKELRRGLGLKKLGERYRGGGKKIANVKTVKVESGFCKKCGAWEGQLGHEPTPELYVKHLVHIAKEIRRVLRDDGTFWINLGDTYWGSGNSSGHTSETKNLGRKTFDYGAVPRYSLSQKKHKYLKPKDLCMIPFEVARALQKDGWFLRRDIIWSKPNPMPESVLDRPSTSHEYIFMFSKSRKYYYDSYAVRENIASDFGDIIKMIEKKDRIGGKALINDDPNDKGNMNTNLGKKRSVGNPVLGRNKRSVWEVTTKPFSGAHFATFPPDLIEPIIKASTSEGRCCAKCGKPYKRIIEKVTLFDDKEKKEKKYRRRDSQYQQVPKNGPNRNDTIRADSNTKYDINNDSAGRLATYRQGMRKAGQKYKSKYFDPHGQEVQGFIRSQTQVEERDRSKEIAERLFPGDKWDQQKFINYIHDHGLAFMVETKGWEKSCRCKTEDTVPAIVLDPFFGSGTTGMVAYDLGRDYLGIELQKNYKDIQKLRLGNRFNQLRLL